MVNTKNIGKITEDRVCNFLIEKGYVILDRNFRSEFGEIDIIASCVGSVSFIEVKKMPGFWDENDIVYKVDNRKQFKIKRTASSYLAHHQDIKYHLISFDVAAVYCNGIQYFKGAF